MDRYLRALAAGETREWRVLSNAGGMIAGIIFVLARGVLDPTAVIGAIAVGLVLKFIMQEAPEALRRRHLQAAAAPRISDRDKIELRAFRSMLGQLAGNGEGDLSALAHDLLINIETILIDWNKSPRIGEISVGSQVTEEILAKTWKGERSVERNQEFGEQLRLFKSQLDEANTAHALVFDEDVDLALGVFRYYATRYSTLCALLKLIEKEGCSSSVSIPRVLGAGGLVVCPENGEIVFLRRASSKTMHPGKLHVFGGNFEPDPHEMGESGRDIDLPGNACREIGEESSVKPKDVVGTLTLAHWEIADPTIQEDHLDGSDGWKRLMRNLPVHYCGIKIDSAERRRMETYHSLEGAPEFIHVSRLEGELCNARQWVPAGWYTTMLWLWMGAPCQGAEVVIGAADARSMAERILSKRES